jgi:signal transduction histidine kinase
MDWEEAVMNGEQVDEYGEERVWRIVIIDDSPETCDVLVRQMVLEGYLADYYTDPLEGLEALKADPPDCVLLDVNMPKITGMELLSRLRANPGTEEVPVIMVTASGDVSDVVQGLDLGANDYITKPPQYEVLSARVRTQLKMKGLQDQRQRDIVELSNLSSLKDKFLQIAAHDLRNPLNNIVLGIDLMDRFYEQSGAEIENFEKLINTMRGASGVMRSIVNDFLDLQEIRTGEIDMTLQPLSLNALVESVIDQYQTYAEEKGVEVRVMLAPSIPEVSGDPDRLMQVISNLISNAIKFSPRGATVGVRSRQQDGEVILEVVDTGPGIPEEELPLLFQEFSRLSVKATGGEKSSGVGLWIARKLIEMHGGEIGVKSKVGHGSLFWFTLPLPA